MEFVRAMKNSDKFGDLIKDISMSEELLNATVEGNETKVAEIIDKVHSNSTSVLNYNNENALSCVISLAYYSARKDYVLIREMPTGKGFADIVFLPKKHSRKPVVVVELKYDKTAVGAVEQIKRKQYVSAVEEYSNDIILVGINYDKQTKTHTCLIEKIIHSEDTQ
jgi:RecB family endonuclease NucS